MSTDRANVNDAIVDFYRAMQAVKAQRRQTIQDASSGAGVDPKDVYKPSKRLRNWHRNESTGVSLKAFARAMTPDLASGKGEGAIVKAWRANKKASR